MPEGPIHDEVAEALKLVLRAWAARSPGQLRIARNLAVRWLPLQLWRREASRAFERVHFGDAPVYSEVLDAWVIAEGRKLFIADDRAGKRRWLDEAQQNRVAAEQNQAIAERAKAEAEALRTARDALERELRELKAKSSR